MFDIFSRIASIPVWLVVLLMALLYPVVVLGIRTFLRPTIVNNLDPLNIRLLVFIGPAILGLVLSPLLLGSASESYYIILIFIALWVLTIRIGGKPKEIDLRDQMGVRFQTTLLLLAVAIILVNVIVNMVIPGKIPLFTEGGFASRFESTENSRVLTWLSLAISQMPGMIYAATQDRRIRKLAVGAVALQVIANLLFASKGAILTIVFIFLNSMFFARARNEDERYQKLRRMLVVSMIIVALLVPVYFSVIGFGSGDTGASAQLAIRFLGGFDQLIFASQFNLLQHAGIDPVMKTNLFEYQLMPFFKALSNHYEYNSVGEYVIEYISGFRIEGPGTYPNSNLILETILTAGKYLGAVFFVLELLVFYWCRRVALRKPITPLSLILVLAFAMNPTELFSSGQDWVTQTILALFTIIASMALSELSGFIWSALRDGFIRTPSVS